MQQWHVELTCKKPELLAFLSTAQQEPLCTVKAGNADLYVVHSDAGTTTLSVRKASGYYLLSSEFESLTDSVAVRNCALTMIPYLNALVKLKIGTYTTPIEIDDVLRTDTNGRLIWVTAFLTANFSSFESKLQRATGQMLAFTEFWLLAQKYPEVDEVLSYIANDTNWFNLYKAFEIMKKETYKLESDGKIARGTFDRWAGNKSRVIDFEESANKERHSSLGYHPRPGIIINYMSSWDEALQFVTSVFFQWLQTKSN